MGKVVQVNGDYTIKALSNSQTPGVFGTITLDTGPGVGDVRVTGNLIVDGDTLTVSATEFQVADNIIVLNDGEQGNGVSLQFAGIEIDRGPNDDISQFPRIGFVFDESDDSFTIAAGTQLTGYNSFVTSGGTSLSNLKVRRIVTDSDTDNGDLILIGDNAQGGVVKVTGTVDYAQQVIDRNDDSVIPNKKYVDDAIQNSPTFQIRSDDTRVVIRDADTTPNTIDTAGSLAYWADITDQNPTLVEESAVGILVDGDISAEFYRNRLEMFGLTIGFEDTTVGGFGVPDTVVLQATNSNANMKIETNGSGKVEFTTGVQFNSIGIQGIGSVSNSTVIFARAPSTGKTGLFFKHESTEDEFISKNKALVFSMLF